MGVLWGFRPTSYLGKTYNQLPTLQVAKQRPDRLLGLLTEPIFEMSLFTKNEEKAPSFYFYHNMYIYGDK